MKSQKRYSHLGALEYLLINKPALYLEINNALDQAMVPTSSRAKSSERAAKGVEEAYASFVASLLQKGWREWRFGLLKERVVTEFHFESITRLSFE